MQVHIVRPESWLFLSARDQWSILYFWVSFIKSHYCKISWRGTYSSQLRPLTAASSSSVILWPVVKYPSSNCSALLQVMDGKWCVQDWPAVIFASISTLESAGIHDSGSSTLSWMGILDVCLVMETNVACLVLTLDRLWHRVSCCKYGYSCVLCSGFKQLTCSYLAFCQFSLFPTNEECRASMPGNAYPLHRQYFPCVWNIPKLDQVHAF